MLIWEYSWVVSPDANWSDTKKPTAPVPRKRSSTTLSAEMTSKRLLRTQLMRQVRMMVAGANLLDRKIPENLEDLWNIKKNSIINAPSSQETYEVCSVQRGSLNIKKQNSWDAYSNNHTIFGGKMCGPHIPKTKIWLWKNPSIPVENEKYKNDSKNRIPPRIFLLSFLLPLSLLSGSISKSLTCFGIGIPPATDKRKWKKNLE